MAKGDKPCLRISAKRKDAPRGSKTSIDIAAAWNGDYGLQVSLDKGVREIVMMDGTVISGADYWLNGRTFGEVRGANGSGRSDTVSANTPSGEPAPTGPDGSIDVSKIPF